jgi:retinol dehydrogenase 12
LSDLSSIKKTGEAFMAKEQRLDVLWHNAGVMAPPAGSKTTQGHELQIGTNCLGPHLLTRILHPVIAKTAASSPSGSVRVIFTGSITIYSAPTGGVDFEVLPTLANYDGKCKLDQNKLYAQSKAGNVLLSAEFARLYKNEGIVVVSLNPGNLRSQLSRHMGGLIRTAIRYMTYEPKYGAYTELFAGLSPDIDLAKTGSYIIPWGRVAPLKADMQKTVQEGDGSKKFWDWCDTETKSYV